MKLTELKECSMCGGEIAPIFFEVTAVRHLLDINAVNGVLGLNQMFGGDAIRLAETMSPQDSVTKVIDTVTFLACGNCFYVVLPELDCGDE